MHAPSEISVGRLRWLAAAAVLAALFAVGSPSRADDPKPSDPAPPGTAPADPADDDGGAAASLDSQVKTAIERGIAWLKTQQHADGWYGDIGTKVKAYDGVSIVYQHPSGPTAIALYAMLKCGVPAEDPVIRKGFEWLRKTTLKEARKAYENSVLLLAITSTGDTFKKASESRAAGDRVKLSADLKKWATDVKDALVGQRSPRGWRYEKNCKDPGGPEDVSSTQLAILALHQAERCGIPVDPAVFTDAIQYVMTLQEKEGPEVDRAVIARPRPAAGAKPAAGSDPEKGRYAPPSGEAPPAKDHARGFQYAVHATAQEDEKRVSGSRTACGVGSLLIARYALEARTGRESANALARLDRKALEKAIYDGLAWLSVNFSTYSNPLYEIKQIYYLYSVERVMDLVGAARLGTHLWYSEMARELLTHQDGKGFWDTKDAQVGARNPVVDTSLAILFLHRATRGLLPVPALTSSGDAPPTDNR